VDFTTSSSLDPTTVSTYTVDSFGVPTSFLLQKTTQAISGQVKTQEFNFGSDERFVTINLQDTDIITILEIKGIKCTATSFQIDIEMKQMLSVKPVELFTKCIIKTPYRPVPGVHETSGLVEHSGANRTVNIPTNAHDISVEQFQPDTTSADIFVTTDVPIIASSPAELASLVKDLDKTPHAEVLVNKQPDPKPVPEDVHEVAVNTPDANENITINTDSYNVETNMGLEEFTIDLDSLTDQENVVIKKSNDVYYEMYREACRKAKIARDLALSSYLEAKRIKNTYMLEDLTDSDESDLEQDSVVE
jgi:hypothetical protein